MPEKACMSTMFTFVAMPYLTMGPPWNFSKASSTDGLTSILRIATEARVTKIILRTPVHAKFLSVDQRLRTS